MIFHVDANSAYLSWTAAALLEKGYKLDIRTVPSAIAGDPDNRHGIILTKSIPAKAYGISTGESLFQAREKCGDLLVFPPDYDLFLLCSDAMYDILYSYTPRIQRYSVDECFLDCTNSPEICRDPVGKANEIRCRIKEELGFTVNIGIGLNKVLAKMAGELRKPDQVHTIWPEEIPDKLWPLPVGELFMVGRATERKLRSYNITTIGDLANGDLGFLKTLLKSHGELVHGYANGIDYSKVTINQQIEQKSFGNSMTMAFDAVTLDEVFQETLALCERVGLRLRRNGYRASLVRIHLRNSGFGGYGHQVQLNSYISATSEIYQVAKTLIGQCWKGEPLRQIGVSVSKLIPNEEVQMTFFDPKDRERQEKLEKAVDIIRGRFGERSIIRGVFANSPIDPIQGGVNDGNYLMMGGYKL